MCARLRLACRHSAAACGTGCRAGPGQDWVKIVTWLAASVNGPERNNRYCRPIRALPSRLLTSSFSVFRRVLNTSLICRWSCRFWPTPGKSCTSGTPTFSSRAAGPTPEHWRIWAEPITPALRITSRRAMARREVILSAGVIGSAQILQCSGVGPAALLEKVGVPLVHDLPGVGQNLQDHLQIRLVFKTRLKTLNDEVNSLLGKALIGLQYLLFRSGPLTLAASQVTIFTQSRPGPARHPVPHAAAECRQARRRRAHILGLHLLGMPVAPAQPRLPGHPLGRSDRLSGDPSELPGRARRPG